jgi:hypothetical protein
MWVLIVLTISRSLYRAQSSSKKHPGKSVAKAAYSIQMAVPDLQGSVSSRDDRRGERIYFQRIQAHSLSSVPAAFGTKPGSVVNSLAAVDNASTRKPDAPFADARQLDAIVQCEIRHVHSHRVKSIRARSLTGMRTSLSPYICPLFPIISSMKNDALNKAGYALRHCSHVERQCRPRYQCFNARSVSYSP